MKVGLVGGTGIRGGRDRLGTRLRAIQDGYGEVSNPGDAPFWTTFRGGGTSRSTVAPDGKVEGEDSWHVGPGRSVVGRGEEGVVEGKGSWKGETDLGKERGTGLAKTEQGPYMWEMESWSVPQKKQAGTSSRATCSGVASFQGWVERCG